MLTATVISPPNDPVNFSILPANEPTGDGVIINVKGIPGNLPKTYGNTVAVWDTWYPDLSSGESADLSHVVNVPTDQQANSIVVNYPFSGGNYLLSYQVGQSVTTMCASYRLSLELVAMSVTPAQGVDLTIVDVTDTTVTVFYSTLSGYEPETSNNWVGVWMGAPRIFGAGKPLGMAPILGTSNIGQVTISGVAMRPRPYYYTLIYFMGPSVDGAGGTNVGSTLCFEVSG